MFILVLWNDFDNRCRFIHDLFKCLFICSEKFVFSFHFPVVGIYDILMAKKNTIYTTLNYSCNRMNECYLNRTLLLLLIKLRCFWFGFYNFFSLYYYLMFDIVAVAVATYCYLLRYSFSCNFYEMSMYDIFVSKHEIYREILDLCMYVCVQMWKQLAFSFWTKYDKINGHWTIISCSIYVYFGFYVDTSAAFQLMNLFSFVDVISLCHSLILPSNFIIHMSFSYQLICTLPTQKKTKKTTQRFWSNHLWQLIDGKI